MSSFFVSQLQLCQWMFPAPFVSTWLTIFNDIFLMLNSSNFIVKLRVFLSHSCCQLQRFFWEIIQLNRQLHFAIHCWLKILFTETEAESAKSFPFLPFHIKQLNADYRDDSLNLTIPSYSKKNASNEKPKQLVLDASSRIKRKLEDVVMERETDLNQFRLSNKFMLNRIFLIFISFHKSCT